MPRRASLVRDDAIATVVQAAYAAATALEAVALRGAPEERHLFRPPTTPFAHLADVTAEIAALDAFTAAVDASDAVGYSDVFIKGAVGDYERLLSLNLGSLSAGWTADRPFAQWSARPTLGEIPSARRPGIHESVIFETEWFGL